MKHLASHLVVILACPAALAQTNPPAAPASRDARGFLPIASADAAPPPPTNAVAAPSAPAASGYVNDDKHKLIPGDKVSFQIIEDRRLPVSLQVAETDRIQNEQFKMKNGGTGEAQSAKVESRKQNAEIAKAENGDVAAHNRPLAPDHRPGRVAFASFHCRASFMSSQRSRLE